MMPELLKKARKAKSNSQKARQTRNPFKDWPKPKFEMRGGVARAYRSHAEELLLSGPAGTGKSLSHLLKIYWICRNYPGARCLIVRQTRESLTESILVTFERDILGSRHPILTQSPNLRKMRQCYRFPNGSEIVVGGLDKPDKTLSSEYDLIYVAEATELPKLNIWEILQRALRAGKVPFTQLIADCNPTTPEHWLYKRCQSGLCQRFDTVHQDNPRYWDTKTNDWTEEGRKYVVGRLSRMTGTRRKRFLLGLWEVAEGLVYDYREELHLLPCDWIPDHASIRRRVWSIDWGKTVPSVLQIWCFDDSGKMYLYRELYQTNLRPDQMGVWARDILDSGEDIWPEAVVCDHDDKCKAEFERTSKLSLSLADKVDRGKGIEEMMARFDAGDDGTPRIFFKKNCRETLRGKDPDDVCGERGDPTCTLEELFGYVYDEEYRRDEPIDFNDHGMDAMRYAGRYVDANTGNTSYPVPTKTIAQQLHDRAKRR